MSEATGLKENNKLVSAEQLADFENQTLEQLNDLSPSAWRNLSDTSARD